MRHQKLFTPGPTEVREEILQTLSTPQIYHRSKEFSELYAEIQPKLQQLFYTKNPVFIFPSSATGAMEAAVINGVRKKCLNLVNGAFSNRWYEITQMNGIDSDALNVEWGKAIKPEMVKEMLDKGEHDAVTLVFNETSTGMMNPLKEIAEVIREYDDVLLFVDAVSALGGVKIEVDKLGIDMCLAGVQKCMALPSGIAVASISERLLERANEVRRGFYFNIPRLYKYHLKNQTMVTPPIPHIFALNAQLDYILKEEGLEKRFARHEKMAKIVQNWARKYFDIFPEKGYESKTVTCIKNTRGISIAGLNEELAKYYLKISNGYGKLKEKTFRIAHMGDMEVHDVEGLLALIEDILNL
ncbi:MAG: alanine--glyoxylate aminotransferase family protein [Thermoplasmata archaeon]|nr:alanine--glyoxylate aminotransferase family protein [Thermoplasmata archaeon]